MAKIMVVDDAAFMRMKCTKILIDNGYEVLEADTGSQAVEKYKLNRPDVVLLDITMPDMDGLTALKKIKEIDQDAKIAMVTAMGQQSIVIDALKGGASDFVVKPFDSSRLLSAVKKLVG